jgi:hypothetical protein
MWHHIPTKSWQSLLKEIFVLNCKINLQACVEWSNSESQSKVYSRGVLTHTLMKLQCCREEVYGRWKQLLAYGEATSPVLSRPSDLTPPLISSVHCLCREDTHSSPSRFSCVCRFRFSCVCPFRFSCVCRFRFSCVCPFRFSCVCPFRFPCVCACRNAARRLHVAGAQLLSIAVPGRWEIYFTGFCALDFYHSCRILSQFFSPFTS